MTLALDRPLALEEFLQLPETKPASEFIDGRIYQKPMPQGKHSRLQSKLSATINQVAEDPKIALAFTELRCTFGGRSIVPDIAVFSWNRIPFDAEGEIENAFQASPDWTIEILSPDQSPTKVISNILHCLRHGSKLGWFVDPKERGIIAFLPDQQPIEFSGQDVVPVLEAIELELTVEQVFNWLKA
jgi:Uma2 family endonuclease